MADRLGTVRTDYSFRVTDPLTVDYAAKDDSGAEGRISLDNVALRCKQDPDACDAQLETVAQSFLEAIGQKIDSDEPDAKQVRAVLKDPQYIAQAEAAIASSPPDKLRDNQLVTKEFAGGLFVVYVIDQPSSMRIVNRETMTTLGLDEKSLHRLAVDNMEHAFPGPLASELVKDGSSIRVIATGDSYEAARLLIPSKWQAAAKELEGPIIAAIPSRDMVIYADGAVAKDIGILSALASKYAQESPYPLSSQLFRFTGEGWELYRTPGSAPAKTRAGTD